MRSVVVISVVAVRLSADCLVVSVWLQVRRLGAVHRYTIQCVLPINLFNEKIYLFLWFWMVFVAIVTAISALTWLLHVFVYSSRLQFVHRFVNLAVKLKVSLSPLHRRLLPAWRDAGVTINPLWAHYK